MLALSTVLRDRLDLNAQHDIAFLFLSRSAVAPAGYTQLASELAPQEVMSLLHRLYTEFDRITLRYNLFKVRHALDALIILTVVLTIYINLRSYPASKLNVVSSISLGFGRFSLQVETIGDSYMVVGNLHTPQPDHAFRIALFALDVRDAAARVAVHPDRPELGTLRVRAGFHTGPCVASVVGDLNPRFCLFGDSGTCLHLDTGFIVACSCYSTNF